MGSLKLQMKVGDMVRCNIAALDSHRNCGLITRIDRTSLSRKYEKRYWVLMHGKKSSFPFLGHQLEVI